MIVMIEAFLRRLWRRLSMDAWMRRFLNLPKIKDASTASGLVMIQVDGLGLTQFERAMRKGNLPFLARLIKKEAYTLRRHYSGLPSNTPGVQGRLFYGVKICVPAFSFKDSRSGKVFSMFNSESAAAVEDRLKDQGEPLLKEGSAYGNIFTGGAKEPHFCASSMGWGSLIKGAHPWGVPLTILMNVHILIRALFLIFVESVLAAVDSVRGILAGKLFLEEIKFIPLRVLVCVVLREIIAAGARIDIARGLPVIHLNLAGYDEQAHHRGPQSAFAHWSLRGIDRAIAKVWKAAHRSEQRHYDVFIYSDHGQEETLSYQGEYNRSVEEAINQVLEEKITLHRWQTEFNQYAPYWRAQMLRSGPVKKSKAITTETKETPPRVVVTTMGPVGHVYLPETLSMEEKEKIAVQLIASAKIPIVMIPSGSDQLFAWNSKGKFILPEEADSVLEAKHPFFEEVVRDLVGLCHHPDSGDFMILGWREGRKSLTFHAEQGSHAGPGPEETSGFALLPLGVLPQFLKETVSTQDLRAAAFRVRGVRLSEGMVGNEIAGVVSEKITPVMGPPALRIMTYNVHSCMGRDGKISPQRIAGIIARHHPDLIALQEIESSEQAHQARIIAGKLGMAFHFNPAILLKKGHRGNAILSKFPIGLVREGRLPELFRAPFLVPRGALWVEMDWLGCKVQVFNTHLSLSPLEGFLQAKALCGPDWMGNVGRKDPVVFCGDLNALPDSKICKYFGQELKNTHFELKGHRPLKTLPSFYPLGLVDHIFVGQGLSTTRIQVPRTELEKISSDHLPLIVDVQQDSPSPIEGSAVAPISVRPKVIDNGNVREAKSGKRQDCRQNRKRDHDTR